MNWDEMDAQLNEAVFGQYARVCTYIPKAGDAFELRFIRHDPTIDQPSAQGYWADIEVIPSELPSPRRDDQVDVDGVRYVVGLVLARPLRNTHVALHKKADRL